MTINNLTVVTPPPNGRERTDVDWNKVERRIGLPLPQDYKDYIALYGAGAFDDFLHVCLPTTKNRNLDLANRQQMDIDTLRELQNEFTEEIPYRVANPVELLPVAVTTNGDIVYWQTDRKIRIRGLSLSTNPADRSGFGTTDRSPVSSRTHSPDESESRYFLAISPIPSPRLPLMTSS